ncbi:MAG: terminase small subunit, partial [Anaerolineae bacterium]|nr:terminase small subunit [Anaerolineae bacterium]
MAVQLSPKRERFAVEYCRDRNATQAAIRAGYSQRTAYSQGQRLLKNVEVASRIREITAGTQISVEEVQRMMAAIARGEWMRYLSADADGKPVLDFIALRDAGLGYLVNGFSVSDRGGVRWELAKAQQTITDIAKTL